MKKVNIGVLGCANIASRMVIPAIKSLEEFNLVAVAGRSAERTREFAAQFNCEAIVGYERLLTRRDIDAVYIPLPNGMHVEWAIRSLESGKHCLVEKPMAMDRTGAKRLVDISTWRKKSLFENFMFIYHSQHGFVREQLENDAVGDIRCVRSSFGFPPLPEGNIRYDKKLGGGALLDAGVYTLRAAQMILGEDLDVEGAYLHEDPETGVDLFGGAFLAGKDNLFAQVAFGFDNFYQCNYEIWGSRGKLTAERAFTAGPGVTPTVVIETQGERKEHVLPADNHFAKLLKEFYYSIISGDYGAQHKQIMNQARLLDQVRKIAGER